MVLASPHHEAAAEAHDVVLDVDHSGFLPGLEDPMHRPSPVKLVDVRTEEAACPPPRRTGEHKPGRRHRKPRVEPPASAPKQVGRDKEIEARHPTVRAEDPGHL